MSDCEEDLDDLPTEPKQSGRIYSWNISRRIQQNQWAAASGITTKIPPLFGGSTSWFKYEELIDDWLDLAVHEESKRG